MNIQTNWMHIYSVSVSILNLIVLFSHANDAKRECRQSFHCISMVISFPIIHHTCNICVNSCSA